MKSFIKTIKVFYGFATRRRFWFAVFMFFTTLSAIFFSLIPYFYKLFVDNITELNYEKLLWILILFIAVRILRMITNNLSYYTGDLVSFDAAINARQSVFKHIQDLDFAYHSQKSTGSLISAMKRGDGAMWEMFHAIHHRFWEVAVGFVMMIAFVGAIDVKIALLIFASFLITVIVARFLVKKNIDARARHNIEEDKISAIIVDNLVNFETVKLFAKESWELQRLKEAFIDWLKYGWKYVNTFRLIDISIASIINISIFLIVLFSLGMIRTNSLTLGDFIMIFGFINTFYPRLFDLVYSLRDLGKSYSDIQRYFSVLDEKVLIKDPANPVFVNNLNGEIKFENVTFTYSESKKEAVKNINLYVREGQSVALVGRSGGGKTTIIKLLMRFYDADKGVISVDGMDIRKFTKSHLRSFIGVVPQEPVMFNNTIGYNIAYAQGNVSNRELEAAAKIANLHDFIMSLPQKYRTNVGERGVKLSGGQKQRLAIARMVLSNPDIVIFDEATSQLDYENETLIQEALWKVVRNKTTIIIAHRLTTAMRADKIIVMDKGRIVETGSHLSLLAKEKGVYKHLWNLQIKKE